MTQSWKKTHDERKTGIKPFKNVTYVPIFGLWLKFSNFFTKI